MRSLPSRPSRAFGLALLLGLIGFIHGLAAGEYLSLVDKKCDTLYLGTNPPVECIIAKEGLGADGFVTYTLIEGNVTKRSKMVPGSHIDARRTFAESITKRGAQALAYKDLNEVKAIMDKGLKHAEKAEKEAAENEKLACLDLARKALAIWPGETVLAVTAVDLMREAKLADDAEALVKVVLAQDPRWEYGIVFLVEVYRARKQLKELEELAQRLFALNPTDRLANLVLGQIEEDKGNFEKARFNYERAWTHAKDVVAGAAAARLTLRVGRIDPALVLARAVLETDAANADASAVAGSALLAQDKADEAAPLLETALKGKLTGELGETAAYNLGLIHFRAGRSADAQRLWSSLKHPAARLGMAMTRGEAFPDEATLPAALRPVVSEYNATLRLQRMDPQVTGLQAGNQRHDLIAQVAAMLARAGDPREAQKVAALGTPEALRWSAFGQVIARRWKEAEAVLAKLPEDDSYAALYRVLAAEGQGDRPRAKLLLDKALQANGPPALASFLQKLALRHKTAIDDRFIEDFAKDSDAPPANGWLWTSTSGIGASTKGGRLVLSGTQSGSTDPVSRLTRLAPAARLSAVRATFDFTGIATGLGGIEVTDEERQNGVAWAVLNDNKFGWRELRSGTWGSWQATQVAVQGNQITLQLDLAGGRVTARHDGGSTPLGGGVPRSATTLAVGLFGLANPGATWSLAVSNVRLEYRQQARSER